MNNTKYRVTPVPMSVFENNNEKVKKKKKIKHGKINLVTKGKYGNRIVLNRCSRNDLCLCQSGKKYKHCIGI